MTTSPLRAAQRTPRRIAFSQTLGRWHIRFPPYPYISPFFLPFSVVGLSPLLYPGRAARPRWARGKERPGQQHDGQSDDDQASDFGPRGSVVLTLFHGIQEST